MKHTGLLLGILFSMPVHAEFTADEMCDRISMAQDNNQSARKTAYLFFDAQETRTFHPKTSKFYPVPLEKCFDCPQPRKFLGDLFGDDVSNDRQGFIANFKFKKVYYESKDLWDGRVLTKIFSYPRKVPDDESLSNWFIYKLCQDCACGEDMDGTWRLMTEKIDLMPVVDGDVFFFYFNDTNPYAPPPALDCVPTQHRPDPSVSKPE